MRISITLPGFSCMVAVARLAVRALLPGNPRAEDAELIVSELATNAIRHSTSRGGQFELAVDLAPGRIRIEVKDGGPFGYPPPPPPKPEPESHPETPTPPHAASVPAIHPWTTMHHEDLNRDRAAEAEEYGFGLAIVTSASDKWGHSRYPDHAVWWAELACPTEPARFDEPSTRPAAPPAPPSPSPS
ncbi:ATP-binding protein [Actinocrinis sp.]|uniref:ATP-binding protein n=1 Tax=Actinocrinis sp. TaxID=1920516 RepID=UPI002D6082A0|nr:ATP-binding protein [Actinocrinis sp.]HZP51583.1 ATP-binding protein [Actinocrinis sp.]